MKKPESPKLARISVHGILEEEQRLARIAEFETFQLDAWLVMMASAAGLTPSDILTVLHYASSYGFAVDVKPGEGGSQTYIHHRRFRGWTPLEIATMIFIADHWHPGKPIPARAIVWSPKYTEKRAITFQITLDLTRYR